MAADTLAALVHAAARLRAAGPVDDELLTALARLLAPPAPPAVQAEARAAQDGPARRPAPAPVEPEVPNLPHAPPSVEPPRPDSTAPKPSREHRLEEGALKAEPSSLEKLAGRADIAPPRQQRAPGRDDAPPPSAETAAAAAPLESLFAANRVRAIVRELTTVTSGTGPLDIAAVVSLIARAEPIERLPRRRASALGHSIHLLFDAGPAMLPFTRDKQQLAAITTRLLGRDRVRIADFLGTPLQGMRPQRQFRWSAIRWPERGSAIVVVGDLGIGEGGLAAAALAAEWVRFIDEAHHRGLRSVALIPYDSQRWPPAATAFGTALTWDFDASVQALRRHRRGHPAS